MDIILALDQGSSSSRTLAFDLKGNALAKRQATVSPIHPREGWKEFDPQELLETQTKTAEGVLRALPRTSGVVAAGIACQRSTVIFWDCRTGKAAMNALSWQDSRAVAASESHASQAEDIHVRTGLILNPFYSFAKIRWAIENSAAVRRLLENRRLRLGPVSTWLLWHWTRGECYCVDPTLAQRMLLYNISKRDWDPVLLKLAGLPREVLPEIRPSAGTCAEIGLAGRKIPIQAVLGDQQAAAFGLGARESGETAANYGTGAFLLNGIGTRPKHVPGLLTSVAYHARGEAPRFFLEGTVNAAGTALEWVKARTGLRLAEKDLKALYGRSTHRVLTLLALGGLGAPRWDTKVMSGFFGLRQATKSEDLVRGTLDSLAFLVSDIADAMAGAGVGIREVRVSGGLSRIDGFLQTQADLLQVEILRLKEHERTALGAAAMAAGTAGARFHLPAEVEAAFEPRIGPEAAGRLKDCWRAFVEGFQGLSRDPRIFNALLDWDEIFPPR